MKTKPDCTGEKFGRLTVLGKGDRKSYKNTSIQLYICQCDCGQIVEKPRSSFDREVTYKSSCGCGKRETAIANGQKRRKPDITGHRFGLLTVLAEDEIRSHQSRLWLVRCDCGREIKLPRIDFEKRDGQRSCGCFSTQLKKRNSGMPPRDLTGQRFGELTVLQTVRGWNTPKQRVRTSNKCRCDCGVICWKTSSQLTTSKFLNCRGANHLIGARYPVMPSPMPDRVGELLREYALLIEQPWFALINQTVQDQKQERLMRAAWIICYREWQGEKLSAEYVNRYIRKWVRFAFRFYNRLDRQIVKKGGEMTNPTFLDYPVCESETQGTVRLSKPRRLSFNRR